MIGDRIEVNLAGGLDVPLPRMVPVKVRFDETHIEDIAGAVVAELRKPAIHAKVKPGMSIAVGCGSRGVANIADAAKAVVGELKALGAKPFIFPAMGSHGAATAAGQRAVLEGYGITEAYVGCPLRATMETAELGRLEDGTPVFMDQYAAAADGVVLINRIKPHTDFRAPIESGIVKMMTIGMGKINGATTYHFHGMFSFGEVLPKAARFIMAHKPFLFGLGLVENAHDDTAIIEAIPAETLFERETDLQAKAKAMMGRLLFEDIDVLVIDEMGKNISGAGCDPNVTGRCSRNTTHWDGPKIKRIAVLDLTEETHGNATGVGFADVITMKIWKKLDVGATYANVITSAYLDGGAIPIMMNTEEDAIKLAVKTAIRVKPAEARIVRIKNTLELSRILVSEPMLEEVKRHPQMEVAGAPAQLRFDADGNLAAA
jgi:Lactate racemase N-terminal domain